MHPSAQNRPFRISRQTHPSPDTPSIRPQASRTPLNYRSNLTLTGSCAPDAPDCSEPRPGASWTYRVSLCLIDRKTDNRKTGRSFSAVVDPQRARLLRGDRTLVDRNLKGAETLE